MPNVALSSEKSRSNSKDAGSDSACVDWIVNDGSGVYRCKRMENAVKTIWDSELPVDEAIRAIDSLVLLSSETVLIASTSLFGAETSGW